jgi:hypothetical protein
MAAINTSPTVLANANDRYRAPPHGARGPRWLANGDNGVVRAAQSGSSVMKTILSALIALSVLTGVAASANAFDAKSFYEQLERSRT